MQIGWLVGFIAQGIADADKTITKFPKFAWWSTVYVLFCIIGVTTVILMDSVHKYQLAVGHFHPELWTIFTDAIFPFGVSVGGLPFGRNGVHMFRSKHARVHG